MAEHFNLQRQQNGEQELVDFVEASAGVSIGAVGQVFNDVIDTFAGDGRLCRTSHGDIEQAQELFERSLVHHIHHTHLDNQEIKHTASGCH